MQNIAKLFNVSIDYLLDDESINFSEYKGNGKYRSKYNAVVKTKFPKAVCITPLIRRKKLNLIESILDFIAPGLLEIADSLNNMSSYYLVATENKQLLVCVNKDFIESKELISKFTEHKKVIGTNLFIKMRYTL